MHRHTDQKLYQFIAYSFFIIIPVKIWNKSIHVNSISDEISYMKTNSWKQLTWPNMQLTWLQLQHKYHEINHQILMQLFW